MMSISKAEFTDDDFETSDFCGGDDCGCVQVAKENGYVAVRDSKNPSQVLYFTNKEWTDFIKGVKSGQYDLD